MGKKKAITVRYLDRKDYTTNAQDYISYPKSYQTHTYKQAKCNTDSP